MADWKQIFTSHRLQYPGRYVSRIEKRALEKLRTALQAPQHHPRRKSSD